MNTRWLVLPVALGTILLTLACYGSAEVPVTTEAVVPDDNQKVAGLPQAPPPRVKKTTAELLLGKWKAVELDGQPVPKTGKYHLEFTASGKLHISTEDQAVPLRVVTGEYKLDGNTIHFHTLADREGKERKWTAKIDSLTSDSLDYTVERDSLSYIHRCRRVADGK